jgi:predicted aconitase
VSYANSVLGARTNFESHMATIPAAITGRIPEYGLHLAANRRPQAIVRVEARLEDPVDWRCLGVYAATRLGDRIPLFEGLPTTTSARQLRDLCAALGPPWAGVPMLHVLGVTPEAPDLRTAFRGRVPRDVETIVVDRRRLRAARELATTATGDRVDLVALGCPQASVADIADIVAGLAGRRAHPDVRLWVWTDAATRATAARMGLLAAVEAAGGEIIADTCGCAACPLARSAHGFRTLATDSTKSCGFVARTGIGTYLGTVRECLDAAVSGRWPAGPSPVTRSEERLTRRRMPAPPRPGARSRPGGRRP